MLSVVKNRRLTPQEQEKAELMEDVRLARQEWEAAERRFQEALGEDQVDYAIYALEAAEKKLDMLLRRAKQIWNREGLDAESGAAES